MIRRSLIIAFAAALPVAAQSPIPANNPKEDAKSLADVNAKVVRVLERALDAENARWTGARAAKAKLTMTIDTIGIRPTGAQSDAAPIVQTALNAAATLGFKSATSASSTDALAGLK